MKGMCGRGLSILLLPSQIEYAHTGQFTNHIAVHGNTALCRAVDIRDRSTVITGSTPVFAAGILLCHPPPSKTSGTALKNLENALLPTPALPRWVEERRVTRLNVCSAGNADGGTEPP